MKIASQVLLWILIVFFSFKIYDSINGPINFNETKNKRYADVISRLKEIRKAQIAHKDVRGFYANNFDSLVSFIDTGIFTLVQKRDSSYLEYDKVYRIDMLKEVIVTDTLGFIPVKDSLFRNIDYANLSKVPVEGIEAVFSIKADIIKKGIELGVDYGITSSCYDPYKNGLPCGHCDACLLRLKGFKEAHINDPLQYPDR